MRIAILSRETLHPIAVGGVASHVTELAAALERRGNEVHVFTRLGHDQNLYDRIHGVHFVEEINNMCRPFVHHVFQTEDFLGPSDVIHAHDWLTANAMIWIKQGRGRKAVITIHSTEYGRCGNNFYGGQSARIREQQRAVRCLEKDLTACLVYLRFPPELHKSIRTTNVVERIMMGIGQQLNDAWRPTPRP